MPFEKQCMGFSSTMQSRYGETPVSLETSFCLGQGFVSLQTNSGLLPISERKILLEQSHSHSCIACAVFTRQQRPWPEVFSAGPKQMRFANP